MNFKVGDKVRVKKGFRQIAGKIPVGDIPKSYEGKEMTITRVSFTGKSFELSDRGRGGSGRWSWSAEWLELVEENEDTKFRDALLAK